MALAVLMIVPIVAVASGSDSGVGAEVAASATGTVSALTGTSVRDLVALSVELFLALTCALVAIGFSAPRTAA